MATTTAAAGRAAVIYLSGVIQSRKRIGGSQVIVGKVCSGYKIAGHDVVIHADRNKAGVASRSSYGAGINQRSQSGAVIIVATVTEHEASLQI